MRSLRQVVRQILEWLKAKTDLGMARRAPNLWRNLSDEDDGDRIWLTRTLDLLPKPFFLVDFETQRISFSNAAARRMLSLEYADHPASEIYGRFFSLFEPSGRLVPVTDLPSARILKGERINGEEFLLKSLNGEFHIKVFSEEIPGLLGRPAAALIVFQDITALKAIEIELRRAKADLTEAIDIAQVGFWSMDTVTEKITISSRLIEQFGIDSAIFDGTLTSALLAIHEDDRARVTTAIQNSIDKAEPYRIEYRVVHPDGTIRWIEAKSGTTGDKTTDASRFTGTTLDITERVQARQALEENERNLRLLADSMPQIVWSANPNGELDYFNQVWFDYSGSTYEDNCRNRWTQYVHPDDLPLTIERWQKALALSEPYENEFRLRSRTGEFRWHLARARPIFENGIVKKWYGSNHDMHDTRLLADKLGEARNIAERANAAKSQFLANMSHEIRTPLGAIMGFSELIRENGVGRVEREEYVSVIERNSAQLLRIIDDILDLSKVEAGMMLIENIEFSLPEVLTDFSSLMGFKAREKGIRFTARAVTSLPTKIHCDPTRLRQILMNVVGNAIKFTDTGFVELRVGFDNEFLDFEVEDTGRGISPEQEANLFQPFTQADASTTRKYGGTGLGLVLTRSLSEALGGHFVLKHSELGRGSVFSVRLRAKAASDSKPYSGLGFESMPARTIENFGQLAGFHILLVEDSPDNQALISIYLGRAGARVDIASDGEQGYKMALAGDYNVILMDVQMPIMDGIAAVKKLREKNYRNPILALTAHAMKEERVRCLQAGFTEFLSKPVVRDDLIKMILTYK